MELNYVSKKIFQYCISFFVLILGAFISLSTSRAATFSLNPSSTTFERQCVRTVDIVVDATGESSNSAGVDITFDPTQVQINSITPGDAYDLYIQTDFDNTAGTIEVTAFSVVNFLTSSKSFATIEFTSTATATTTSFEIDFDGVGFTLDSNIADSVTAVDLLTSVSNGNYSFIDGPCFADTERPNITFIDPTNNERGVEGDRDVQIRITDNQSGIDLSNTQFVINGVTYEPSDPQVTFSGTSLNYEFTINPDDDFPDDAASTVTVSTQDQSGNSRSRQITFNIPVPPPPPPPDREEPDVIFITPENLEINVENGRTIQIRLTDEDSGVSIADTTIYFNNDVYDSTDSEFTFVGNPNDYIISLRPIGGVVEDALNSLRITGEDVDGNDFDRQIVFNIPTDVREVEVPVEVPIETVVEVPVEVYPDECPVVDIPVSSDPMECPEPEVRVITETVERIVEVPVQIEVPLLEESPLNEFVDDNGLATLVSGGSLLLSFLGLLRLLALAGYSSTIFRYFGFLISYASAKQLWGSVIDAKSGKPIKFATCRLYLPGTQYVIDTTVSDPDGKYGFIAKRGEYRLSIQHQDYEEFTETIKIQNDSERVIKDVYLLPKHATVAFSKLANSQKFWIYLRKFLNGLSRVIFILGFLFAIIGMVLLPNIINGIILGLYILFGLLEILPILLQKPRSSTIISSSNQLRIPYAQIKIYNPDTWELIDSTITNYNGEFDFYGKPGRYALLVAAKGYKFPSTKNTFPLVEKKYSSMIYVDLQKGNNNLNIYLDPVDLNSSIQNTSSQTAINNLPSPF